jgi:uncharacterized NAD(P)/FAD-binding protein YdhS
MNLGGLKTCEARETWNTRTQRQLWLVAQHTTPYHVDVVKQCLAIIYMGSGLRKDDMAYLSKTRARSKYSRFLKTVTAEKAGILQA